MKWPRPPKRSGRSERELVEEALKLHVSGASRKALALLRKAIRQRQNNPVARGTYAVVLSDLRRYEEAEQIMNRLAEDFASDPYVAINRAVLWRRMQKFDRASAEAKRALSLKPDEAGFAGEYLDNLGVHAGPTSIEIEVRRLAPQFWTDADCLGSAAEAATRARLVDLACKLRRRCAELEPGSTVAWANLAGALVDCRRLDEAAQACQQALDLDPQNYIALANLASLAKGRGDLDQAIEYYRQVLRICPDYGPAAVEIAVLGAWQGRSDP